MGELIPLREARQRLGISKTTMSRLVRERWFTLYENPLDRRERLVDWEEVQRVMRPRPLVEEDARASGRASGL